MDMMTKMIRIKKCEAVRAQNNRTGEKIERRPGKASKRWCSLYFLAFPLLATH